MATGPARDLLALLEDHLRQVKSPRARMRRHAAAAALARACALLEGMMILREQGRADVAGVLGRSHLEACFLGLYVLYKGAGEDDDSVIVELAASETLWSERMVKAGNFTGRAEDQVRERRRIVDSRQAKLKALDYLAIATQLKRLVPDSEGNVLDFEQVYHKVYRGESQFSVHAGIGSLGGYIAWDPAGTNDAIELRPQPAFSGTERICTILTCYLARHVFRAFGVRVEPPLDEVLARIVGDQDASDGSAELM